MGGGDANLALCCFTAADSKQTFVEACENFNLCFFRRWVMLCALGLTVIVLLPVIIGEEGDGLGWRDRTRRGGVGRPRQGTRSVAIRTSKRRRFLSEAETPGKMAKG